MTNSLIGEAPEAVQEERSEFGRGLLYPIGLFLKHAERGYYKVSERDNEEVWRMWWQGAADHLMDLQIPESLSDKLREKASRLEAIAIEYRLPMKPRSDYRAKAQEAIGLATEILMEADHVLGIPTMKGEYE